MYMPAHFEENRPEVLHRLIAEQPFGALITNGPNGLDANHVPFEFDVPSAAGETRGILRAHVARANPVWQEAAANPDALVIFQGPAAYISPNWYPSKHEAHRQVPTYNYMVVHAHGRIVVRDEESFVRGLVARLTRKMEAGEPVPWKMGDAPTDFISQMLGAIVGIEIEVTRLVGKWKLGQNKVAADRRGAAETLLARSSDEQQAVGQAMLDAPPAF
ncbi:FMN-binding negative transcriptional regulator [Paraburkholderia xenovorans]|uniref:FMN-binding negative transcriptional regulator n=1 Tax=Paraburkholderia xenovorans TaxID=36873 RepID=UPI0038BA05D2